MYMLCLVPLLAIWFIDIQAFDIISIPVAHFANVNESSDNVSFDSYLSTYKKKLNSRLMHLNTECMSLMNIHFNVCCPYRSPYNIKFVYMYAYVSCTKEYISDVIC